MNGLRISLDGTCGWFIWADADASTDPNFYQPLHVEHIAGYLPSAVPYLSLPPGYRFQIAGGVRGRLVRLDTIVGKMTVRSGLDIAGDWTAESA